MKEFIITAIGLIATVISVYVGASFSLAQKQLLAATRLLAYLRNSGIWVLENDLFPIFRLGQEWNDEVVAVVQTGGGSDELVKLQQKKMKLLDEIMERWNGETEKPIIPEYLTRLPKEQLLTTMADYAKLYRQNIILGHTFITDEEAATLGVGIAGEAINLKMGVVELWDKCLIVSALAISKPDQFSFKDHLADFKKMLWKGMVLSRQHFALTRASESITSLTILQLTWRNIKQGSRITKQ